MFQFIRQSKIYVKISYIELIGSTLINNRDISRLFKDSGYQNLRILTQPLTITISLYLIVQH